MLQSNKEHIEYSDMMMLHIQVKDTKTLKTLKILLSMKLLHNIRLDFISLIIQIQNGSY